MCRFIICVIITQASASLYLYKGRGLHAMNGIKLLLDTISVIQDPNKYAAMNETTCSSPAAAGMMPKPAGAGAVDGKDTPPSVARQTQRTASEPSGPQLG